MSIVVFAAWLFVFLVLGPIVFGLVRIFFPWIVGTVIAALYVVPAVLFLLFIVTIVVTSKPPQRYQTQQSDDTSRGLDELYKDPSFRRNVGLPASPDVKPSTVPTETPAPRAALVLNPIPVTGQPSAGPIPVTGQP